MSVDEGQTAAQRLWFDLKEKLEIFTFLLSDGPDGLLVLERSSNRKVWLKFDAVEWHGYARTVLSLDETSVVLQTVPDALYDELFEVMGSGGPVIHIGGGRLRSLDA